ECGSGRRLTMRYLAFLAAAVVFGFLLVRIVSFAGRTAQSTIQPSGGGLAGTAKMTQAMPTSAPAAAEPIPHRSARNQRGKIVRLKERSITIALPARPQTSTQRAVATLPTEQTFSINDTTEIFIDRFVRERTKDD